MIVGTEWRINTLRSRSVKVGIEIQEPSEKFAEIQRSVRHNRLLEWSSESPEKDSELSGTTENSAQDNKLVGLFVAGLEFVWDVFHAVGFTHTTISIPLDSTACPILNIKIENELIYVLSHSKPFLWMRGLLFIFCTHDVIITCHLILKVH
jgi:hypothetical protein